MRFFGSGMIVLFRSRQSGFRMCNSGRRYLPRNRPQIQHFRHIRIACSAKKFRDDFVIGINKGVRHFSLALKDGIGVRGNGENFKVGVNRAACKFHTDAVGEIALRQALRKSKCRAALSSPHFAAGGQPGAQLCRPRRIPATEP